MQVENVRRLRADGLTISPQVGGEIPITKPANLDSAQAIVDAHGVYQPIHYTGEAIVKPVSLGLAERMVNWLEAGKLRQVWKDVQMYDKRLDYQHARIPGAMDVSLASTMTKPERIFIGQLPADFGLKRRHRRRDEALALQLVAFRNKDQESLIPRYAAHYFLLEIKNHGRIRNDAVLLLRNGRMLTNTANSLNSSLIQVLPAISASMPSGDTLSMLSSVSTASVSSGVVAAGGGIASNAAIGTFINAYQASDASAQATRVFDRHTTALLYAQNSEPYLFPHVPSSDRIDWSQLQPRYLDLCAIARNIVVSQNYMDHVVDAIVNTESAVITAAIAITQLVVLVLSVSGVIALSSTGIGLPIALGVLSLVGTGTGLSVIVYRVVRNQWLQYPRTRWAKLEQLLKELIHVKENQERISKGATPLRDPAQYVYDRPKKIRKLTQHAAFPVIAKTAQSPHAAFEYLSAVEVMKERFIESKLEQSRFWRALKVEIQNCQHDFSPTRAEAQIQRHLLATTPKRAIESYYEHLIHEQSAFRLGQVPMLNMPDLLADSVDQSLCFTQFLLEFEVDPSVIAAVVQSDYPEVAKELLGRILFKEI